MALAVAGMLCLIFDSRCAAESVRKSMELCIITVIPSLFPLFVLSGLVVSGLTGTSVPLLNRLLNLPRGGESIFLLGAVGGFPMGAQCISQACEQGSLSRENAARMLGFCNNCGPAFLFGILGNLFSDSSAPLALLIIQLECACLIAMLWPGTSGDAGQMAKGTISLVQAVNQAVRSMVSVCAWIILAGVLLGFLERWLFPILPGLASVLLTGVMELTNGCMALKNISDEGLRFRLCCGFVCFGGISVLLQIQGLTAPKGIPMRTCICQKLWQGVLGLLLGGMYVRFGWAVLLLPLSVGSLLKFTVEKRKNMVYNGASKGGFSHDLSEKDAQILSVLRPQHQVHQ